MYVSLHCLTYSLHATCILCMPHTHCWSLYAGLGRKQMFVLISFCQTVMQPVYTFKIHILKCCWNLGCAKPNSIKNKVCHHEWNWVWFVSVLNSRRQFHCFYLNSKGLLSSPLQYVEIFSAHVYKVSEYYLNSIW